MTLTQRLVREPNLILGVLTAGLSLAVLFGLSLSGDQMAGIGIFVGAVIALIRFVTTPASEVVAQQKPDDPGPVAGPASPAPSGVPVVVLPSKLE